MRSQRVILLGVLFWGLAGLGTVSYASPSREFDFLSFIKTAWDTYNRIKNFLEPDPNLADLIEQAKQEILDEINIVRAEEQIADVEALIEQYRIYLNNPPSQQTIEAWIRDAINAANQFEILIENKSPRIAYYCAQSYNTLIPLLATMMQRHGIRPQDILPQLRDAIATNTILLGRFVWAELPNVPIYWNSVYGDGSYVGKFLKCYHEGLIDQTEYERIYLLVWTANEEMRKQTIEGYDQAWFYISNERDFSLSPGNNLYLCAHSHPRRCEAKVVLLPLQPGNTDFLWRLEFVTPSMAKIVHWSGKYLALKDDKRRVVLTPRPEWQNEYWDFNPYYFSNRDRVTITAAVGDGYWLTADGDSVRASPTSSGPSVLGYQSWIMHHALTGAPPVGSFAFPCPADYDGDGKADLAMKVNDGRWLLDFARNGFGSWDLQVSSHSLPAVDKSSQPAPADYDGDGKADIAIKDDLTGEWCIDYAHNGFGSWDLKLPYGGSAWFYQVQAVPADYDGDGKADVAIFGYYGGWSFDFSADAFSGWNLHAHGLQAYYPEGNIYPAPADYDGDGKADVAIKVDDGRWLIDWARDGFQAADQWDWVSPSNLNYGGIGAIPAPGQYGSDRAAAIGVKTEEGRWMTDAVTGWGLVGIDWVSEPIYGGKDCVPIPADYDGDGMVDLSTMDEQGNWSVDYSNNGYGRLDWVAKAVITGVSYEPSFPAGPAAPVRGFALRSSPNPFNSVTTIHFSLSRRGRVVARVFAITGAEVVTLVDGVYEAGEYFLRWDGRDRSGRILPSGVYLCRFVSISGAESLKLLLLR
jgi:hypothetical protein